MYVLMLNFGTGFAFDNVRGQLYPMMGFCGSGTRVRGKLGLEPPQGWRDQIFVEQNVGDISLESNDGELPQN